jgi:signal peptidase I
MAPEMDTGSIAFVENFPSDEFNVGDIVIYKLPGRSVPIIHRIIRVVNKYGGFFVVLIDHGRRKNQRKRKPLFGFW